MHQQVDLRDEAVVGRPSAPRRVVPARHPWRWVATVLVVLFVVQLVRGLVSNPGWNWPVFAQYFLDPTVLRAVGTTLELTLYGTLFGFGLGLVVALMRLSGIPLLVAVAWTYVWIFRAVPLIVQLLFWFNIAYLYRDVGIGIPGGPQLELSTTDLITPVAAAVLGLALHQAAYAAEIIRAGILAVDGGQREAAAALGLPRSRQLRRIVLPQAMRTIVPNAVNEIVTLLKGTSIVSVMALAELFYQVQVIYGRTGQVVPLLMVATVWYVLLTGVLSIVQYYVERHFAKGERALPPTPTAVLRARLASLASKVRR